MLRARDEEYAVRAKSAPSLCSVRALTLARGELNVGQEKSLMAAPIMTVTGPVDPGALGLTLPHEHVLCDFGGAKVAGPHRYDAQDLIRVMRPWLAEAAARVVRAIADCSPAYLGRDVRVLRALSESSGGHHPDQHGPLRGSTGQGRIRSPQG